MDKTIPTVIVVAIIVVVLVGMYFGWRARQRRQAGLAAVNPVPADLGEVLLTVRGLYVATTVAGEPLERIAVRGLGYRARAELTVAAAGIALALTGEEPMFIPVADLRRVDRATWAIDEGVETGGLLLVGWTLGSAELDSYLRIDGPADPVIEAIGALLEDVA
ncbi:MAG TPA: hypothetical protein VIQ78_08480 [Terrimesophilobacter sp.]|uniref:PH-like domain-containing protein n=1 Tax=Terrimesophilobacter sp. TaxID=2906435 RepID=UPI002F92CADC